MTWTSRPRVAAHWEPLAEGAVRCHLCPRHCKLRPGQKGFCGVRGNVAGSLHTFNFGVSVEPAQETIETEAVYHYRPGSRILSLGNVGCMMACSFCHNWETSQVKHLNPRHVRSYSPRQIVDLALEHGIGMLSWTYNDPVVWHEFVTATARLARRHGIQNLYKSAFYIEGEPARELCEVIDVFSISLKSMSPDFYRRVTKGRLEPVLKAIEIVHRSGRHLEISQLIVTGLNDDEEEPRRAARWIVDTLGPDVPLHFVRFHPAFRWTKVSRTPVSTLLRARRIALGEGIRHCYLGNTYEPGVADSACRGCGTVLVERCGLAVRVGALSADARCARCGARSAIREPLHEQPPRVLGPETGGERAFHWSWSEEVNSLHVAVPARTTERVAVCVVREPSGRREHLCLGAGLSRVIVSRASLAESGVTLLSRAAEPVAFLPVLDRAHYPVSALPERPDPAALRPGVAAPGTAAA